MGLRKSCVQERERERDKERQRERRKDKHGRKGEQKETDMTKSELATELRQKPHNSTDEPLERKETECTMHCRPGHEKGELRAIQACAPFRSM